MRLVANMDYGKILRELRLSAGLTQQQIADALHVDRAHTSHIEQGRRKPSVDALERWVEICGGTFQILRRGDTPDPLASLTAEQRAVVTAMEQLPNEDAARIVEVARALRQAQSPVLDMLRAQIDGPVAYARNSASPVAIAEKMVG